MGDRLGGFVCQEGTRRSRRDVHKFYYCSWHGCRWHGGDEGVGEEGEIPISVQGGEQVNKGVGWGKQGWVLGEVNRQKVARKDSLGAHVSLRGCPHVC